MSDQKNFLNLLSATSSQGLASGAAPSEVQDGQTIDLFGPDPARVNLSAVQADERGLLTSGISGPIGTTSSKSAALQQSFGEQVASKDGLGWLDLVQTDMEAKDYAFGAFDLSASGFGAPHIRQRLWFVADTDNAGSQGWIPRGPDQEREDQHGHAGRNGATHIGVGNTDLHDGRHGDRALTSDGQARVEHGSASATIGLADTQRNEQREGRGAGREGQARDERGTESSGRGTTIGLADTASSGRQHEPSIQPTGVQSEEAGNEACGSELSGHSASSDGPDKTNGHWRDADWLFCRDGKWRPVEPESCPLADGAPSRVGRLRAYGNGIVLKSRKV